MADGLLGGWWDAGSSLVNFAMQASQQKYQKDMQRKAWAREDNAVQRRSADLEKAGINPILAAGSAAQSSSPITLQTPELNGNPFAMQSNIAHTNSARKLAEMQTQSALKGIDVQDKQIAKLQADTDLTKLQGALLVNQALKSDEERKGVELDNAAKRFEQNFWQTQRGIPINSSGWTKEISTGGAVASKLFENIGSGAAKLGAEVAGALQDVGGKVKSAVGGLFRPKPDPRSGSANKNR